MANLVTLPFIKKEGKYFAPIASEEPSFVVVSGAVVAKKLSPKDIICEI